MKQEDYLQEASERRASFSDGAVSDLVITRAARVAIENAYRRGYHQGFSAAVNATGKFLYAYGDEIAEYELPEIKQDICDWRHAKHGGKFERPPEFKY